MTLEQAISYIRNNYEVLDKAAIADRISMDRSSFVKAVKGLKDARGTAARIPAEKLPALIAEIEKLQIR